MTQCERCGYDKDMSDLSTSIHFMSHPRYCPKGAWLCDACADILELTGECFVPVYKNE